MVWSYSFKNVTDITSKRKDLTTIYNPSSIKTGLLGSLEKKRKERIGKKRKEKKRRERKFIYLLLFGSLNQKKK